MKKKLGLIATIFLTLTANSYADDPVDVQEGVQTYDWQTCVDNKSNACLNECATSNDIHCKDNCNDLANDKCRAKGLVPPQ